MPLDHFYENPPAPAEGEGLFNTPVGDPYIDPITGALVYPGVPGGGSSPFAGGSSGSGTGDPFSLANAPGLGSTETGVVNGINGLPAVSSGMSSWLKFLMSVPGIANALRGGGGGALGSNAISSQMSDALGMANNRMRQVQPNFDALVRMAYGMTPMQYRGQAPAGYTGPSQAQQDTYRFEAPRFGGAK